MENNDIKTKKNEFRAIVRKLKSELSEEDKRRKSAAVFAKVRELEIVKKAKVIMMYWSLPDELQTHDAVLEFSATKKVILPVVKGDILELREFRGVSQLSSDNALKIGEPVGDEFTDRKSIELIIVPGVAFDKKNNRLGRGKAYYDKLLIELNALKIGVCFNFQYFDEVPVDEYDVKMDMVVFA